jgi:hypothetical protein
MKRVFEPRGFFTVPDGTDVSPFLNATDSKQPHVPWERRIKCEEATTAVHSARSRHVLHVPESKSSARIGEVRNGGECSSYAPETPKLVCCGRPVMSQHVARYGGAGKLQN